MTQDAGFFIGLLSLSLAAPLAYAGHTLMLSQWIGEALTVDLQYLIILVVFLFLQALWRDPSVLFSRKESL